MVKKNYLTDTKSIQTYLFTHIQYILIFLHEWNLFKYELKIHLR